MIRDLAKRLFGITEIEQIYEQSAGQTEIPVFESVRRALDLRLEVSEESRRRIPREGPLIVVANHPTGGMDGVLLASFLLSLRRDVKILAHAWFARYPRLAEHMFFVDPSGEKDAQHLNLSSLKTAVRWVREGGVLLAFPAGTVACLQRRNLQVTDPPWQAGLARIIRMSRSPVVPVNCSGRNSWLYQLAALAHRRLGVLLLARELLNKRGEMMRLQVGEAIPFDRLAGLTSDDRLIDLLRRLTFGMRQGAKCASHGCKTNWIPPLPEIQPPSTRDEARLRNAQRGESRNLGHEELPAAALSRSSARLAPAPWSWSQLAGLAAVLGAYAFVGASVVVSLLVVAECIMKLLSGNEMLAGGLPLGPSARW